MMPANTKEASAPIKKQIGKAPDNQSSGSHGSFFPPAMIQTKLSVNTPGDQYEQEADHMADKVMSMPIPGSGPKKKTQFFSPSDSIRRKNHQPPEGLHRAEQTLSEAKKSGTNLPMKQLETMDINKLIDMSDADRRNWYIQKLGPYEKQLHESADKYMVPVQLLATVILNELADIDYTDILQSNLGVNKGSLGIAQIQIDTAIKDNLFPDITPQEGKDAYKQMVTDPQYSVTGKLAARLMETDDDDKRMAVNRRLQIPQYAIDAAAAEVRVLLNQMISNTGSDWQTRYGFTHKGIPIPLAAQAIYKDVGGASQREKELNLGTLITGAYNSPKIITAVHSDDTQFPNANIHGSNSRLISGDLYNFNLFRP
jgi:hypothetical protein